ncbi:hypothetical protein [Mucilaginibacter sp. PAMB04168]|uniref:hypothetical protein n=1 Tax=Mucilaginibacter sp. PAMB04168 TaxID=3138567 RepID=UPI0031F6AE6C
MNQAAQNQRLVELTQRWMMGMMSKEEYQELNLWFRSLEDRELGGPDFVTVELVELRLHQRLMKEYKPNPDAENIRPPWDSLNR